MYRIIQLVPPINTAQLTINGVCFQFCFSVLVVALNPSICLKGPGFQGRRLLSLFIALLKARGALGTLTNGIKGYLIWLSLLPLSSRQKSSLQSLKSLELNGGGIILIRQRECEKAAGEVKRQQIGGSVIPEAVVTRLHPGNLNARP